MNVSFWQNVIRTEFTEAAYCHIYILFIGSFSSLPPPPHFHLFCERFRLTSYPYPHLELSLSGCICCRTGANIPDGDGPGLEKIFLHLINNRMTQFWGSTCSKKHKNSVECAEYSALSCSIMKYLRHHSQLLPPSLREATNCWPT